MVNKALCQVGLQRQRNAQFCFRLCERLLVHSFRRCPMLHKCVRCTKVVVNQGHIRSLLAGLAQQRHGFRGETLQAVPVSCTLARVSPHRRTRRKNADAALCNTSQLSLQPYAAINSSMGSPPRSDIATLCQITAPAQEYAPGDLSCNGWPPHVAHLVAKNTTHSACSDGIGPKLD